jgi:hypothetical protein
MVTKFILWNLTIIKALVTLKIWATQKLRSYN